MVLQGGGSAVDDVVVAGSDPEVGAAIARAQAGDPRGYQTLFAAFGARVAGFLRTRGVSDPDGVADEVFLRAFRTIHTFSGDARQFRAWLFTIARNAALDDARRRRRRVQEAPLTAAPEPAGDEDEVEAEVLAELAHERVCALLEGLSADQRDVLMLRIVADLSVADTAAALGKSYEAVKALQHRAVASLRRSISSGKAVPR